ncbi:MAG: hypothetical protein Q8L23_05605 [Caulobacter sp.]|nr:hypothetical protein [Caulobacter sp.]
MFPTPLFIFTASLPFVTILLVFGMRYFALIQQAKARLANDDAYRQIAEKALADHGAAAAALTSIETRLAAIEKILKDVG